MKKIDELTKELDSSKKGEAYYRNQYIGYEKDLEEAQKKLVSKIQEHNKKEAELEGKIQELEETNTRLQNAADTIQRMIANREIIYAKK